MYFSHVTFIKLVKFWFSFRGLTYIFNGILWPMKREKYKITYLVELSAKLHTKVWKSSVYRDIFFPATELEATTGIFELNSIISDMFKIDLLYFREFNKQLLIRGDKHIETHRYKSNQKLHWFSGILKLLKAVQNRTRRHPCNPGPRAIARLKRISFPFNVLFC